MRKFFTLALALVLAILLAACGGGGGGSPEPQPNPGPTPGPVVGAKPQLMIKTMSPAPVTTSVVIVSDEDVTRAEVSVQMPTGEGQGTVTIPIDGTTLIQAGNRSIVWTPYKEIPAGATLQVSATACSADNVCGTMAGVVTIEGGKPAVLHYTDKVLALWTAAYPYAVTKEGVTQVVNKTSVAGLRPFFNCWLYKTPQADGRVLASCQQVLVFTRKVYQIDPVANEMRDYDGPMPSDTDPNWVDVQAFDPAKPEWSAKTRVSDGWFFTTDTAWVLKFQPDTGATTTVKEGTFEADGTVKALITYNN